jgi:hypothetical protein
MSTEYDYERCIIEVGPTLKKRGVEDYQEIAANMCRMRVDEGTPREFAASALLRWIWKNLSIRMTT